MGEEAYKAALERYRALVGDYPDIEVKGKANPYTSMNGNMFSFLDKEGVLCLRLSKTERDAFAEKHRTEPVVQYGAVMKEYASIPEDIAGDSARLREIFDACLAYAKTLPAKSTKKG